MSTDDLKKWGLTDEQVSSVMEQFGKDVTKLQRENENLKTDLDKWKKRAESAEETLKSFDGIDPAEYRGKLSEYQKKAEEAEKNAQAQIYERDFADALKSALESVKFTSEAAKRDVISQIKAADLKLKDGKILGLSDLIEQIKKSDASAFSDEHQERLEEERARFTQPQKPGGGAKLGTLTKKDIMDIKDPSERQAAIAGNMSLFGK